MMRHLAPGTVHMEHAQKDFRSTAQDRASSSPFWATAKAPSWAGRCRTTTRRVRGNAAAATADKGRAVAEAAAVQLVALLREPQALPLSTLRSPTLV